MTLKRTALPLIASLAAVSPWAAAAGPASLLGDGYLGGGGGALIPVRREMPASADHRSFIGSGPETPATTAARTGSSLFAGQAAGSLFAPLPPREKAPGRGYRNLGGAVVSALGPHVTGVERLRHLIGYAEAGPQGYDAINHGARRLPARSPTEMRLGDIYAWIAATPGQPHAIGRYQFIPATLKRLARQVGAGEHERFSPGLQDRLADELFAEAGLQAYRDGLMRRTRFMNNLAKIWAGLPNSSGRSHYHGYAGNRATMTWAHFDAEIAKLFRS